MRILFICGSVEPGKDGVGDYTRRLAAGFINRGNTAAIIAINEKKFTSVDFKAVLTDGKTPIEAYRLSSNLSWAARQAVAQEIIKNFDPDLISLQFVPFSYHDKGLPFFLPSWLRGIRYHHQVWHVMFHELWIADSKANTLKELIVREMQKFIIKRLLKKMKCNQVNTSNTYYYNMLRKIGYEAGVLPIFSNLPKGKKVVFSNIQDRESKVVGVLFGNIQDNPLTIKNISLIAEWVKDRMNKQLCIVHIGNNRNLKTRQLLHDLTINVKIQAYSVGFLNENEAADMLASADLGLSNYSPELLQKSGSISSMLYNGLPVILLSDKEHEMAEVPEISRLDKLKDIKMFINQSKHFASRYSAEPILESLERDFLKKTGMRL